ncbi:MAG: aerobic-type carbon monoxide dehydrogenase, large subunit-like protein, partial [Armatimonadetes bacterium]|nr:aerobic-type carbon monoxide dehydrogenase, large subunit-like protein [Armatimonadota bacterium]
VAVIADNSWAALQGRKALKLEWDLGENANYSSDAFKKQLIETARKPCKVVRKVGDVDAEFAKGGKVIEADYYTPMLAHAPMEPPAAVVEYKNGKVVALAATQNPQAVQETVALAVGIEKKDVTCHVTLLGGGFGRKSKPDYIAEAAVLSKKLSKPVKIVWSREDDIQHDYYHTVAAMHMKAVTDAKGRPTALLQRSVFPTIASTFDPSAQYGADFEMAHGWVDMPFDIPNIRAENGAAKNQFRVGWLRSVANIYHAFAIQSFMDELAAAAGRDRIEYFLEVLGEPREIDYAAEGTENSNYGRSHKDHPVDTGRLRKVVEAVAQHSGWKQTKPKKGRALGFAAHRSFLSYVAAVADVEVDKAGKVKIHRVDVAVDAGQVIHPDRVKAQFEGAATFAATIALMGEITIKDGRLRRRR